jgi:hypothetical protein
MQKPADAGRNDLSSIVGNPDAAAPDSEVHLINVYRRLDEIDLLCDRPVQQKPSWRQENKHTHARGSRMTRDMMFFLFGALVCLMVIVGIVWP